MYYERDIPFSMKKVDKNNGYSWQHTIPITAVSLNAANLPRDLNAWPAKNSLQSYRKYTHT